MLLVDFAEPEELPDHLIRFRRRIYSVAATRMGLNRFEQILRAAIVEEKDSLSEAPQGRCAEFVSTGIALTHIVGQSRSHVMECQIGEQIDVFVLQRRHRLFAGVQRRGMAHRAADVSEYFPAPNDGVRVGCRRRRRQEAHEHRELHHIA